MKLHRLFLSFFALALLLAACDDDLNTVGLSTMPDRDGITTHTDTIYLGEEYTTTVEAGPVRINPSVTDFLQDASYPGRYGSFLLGNFYDPFYGFLKADFISTFYTEEELFPETFQSIDSVLLVMHYRTWVGDSLSPMTANVYPALPTIHTNASTSGFNYSDINLQQHSDPARLWGSKTYTAHNQSVPDSTASANKVLTFDISNQWMADGTTVLDAFDNEWRTRPETFKRTSSFSNFFPGVYVTTTAGNGNLLKIHNVTISIKFRYRLEVDGVMRDTIGYTGVNTANDVIQSFQYKNSSSQFESILGAKNQDASYIKAPAGAYTQYTVPIKEISQLMDSKGSNIINSVKFKVTAYPQDDWKYALNAPSKLLLIRKDSVDSFFRKAIPAEAPYSFRASYSSGVYDFGDISSLIRPEVNKNASEQEDVEMLLIPIAELIDYYSDGYSQTAYIRKTAYDIVPSGVKLRTGKEHLRLEIFSTATTAR